MLLTQNMKPACLVAIVYSGATRLEPELLLGRHSDRAVRQRAEQEAIVSRRRTFRAKQGTRPETRDTRRGMKARVRRADDLIAQLPKSGRVATCGRA